MHVGEECVRFCSHGGVVRHVKRSAFEACPKEEVAHVGNVETRHQTAANVGQTGSDGGVRLLPGDLGKCLRERFLEAEPRIEREGIVDQLGRNLVLSPMTST